MMKETKKSRKIFGKGRWEVKAISMDQDQIPAPADEQYSVAVKDAPVDAQVAQIHNVLAKERSGLDEMAITERDVRNELAREKRLKMQDGDANAMLNYFNKMSQGNQNFFHTFRLDAAGQLQDILWVDARSRAAYEEFGDVVVFDTTYLTNQYELPFANFVGVNHHGQTILLGCALISHETTDTFTWLFREWLHCMSGKAPVGILTDQGAAMKRALSLTMPETTHRLCIWHITSKFSAKLGKRKDFDKVKEDLLDAIYDSLTPEEFVQKWCGVIEKHGLTENEWLDGVYREKEMWVPAYTKHLFWAGMKTTQRVESIHSFFDDYVDKHTRLCEFAESYCEAMEARAEAEKQFDAHSASSVRQLMTGFPAEAVFQRCYTNMKFREVQRECTRIVYLHCFGQKRMSEHETEYVIEDRVWCRNKKTKKEFVTQDKTNYRVRYDSRTMLVDCECKMFECNGIMCRHMIKLYDILGVFEVPERYILRRWRKDVQRKHTRVKVAYHDPSKTEQVRGYDKLQLAFEPICSKASVHKGTIDLVLELLELMDIRVDEKTTMIENELLNQIPSSVCNQQEKQASPVSTTAALKRKGNRSGDIGLAEEDDVPNETDMDLSQPQRVIIHCKTGVNEVCEKFDELEVIEDSNEIAKKFNMNTNNPNMMINFDAYEDIPVEVSGENVPKPVNTFAEIDLGKALNENIRRCKYDKPTPIQRHAIPIAMMGRDLMACAQTGSGKTAAFCFPIIAGILKRVPPYRPPLSLGKGGVGGSDRMICPVALIMSPTRELSSQTHDEAKKFSYQTGVKVAVAYGGTPMGDQLRLAKGVDILVATPGRLVDMIERGKVSLRMVRYLALDEADRMLDMGFEPQIRKIVQQMDMPLPGSRQTMLFSATFPTEIQRLASDFLRDYIFLTVGKVGSSTDLIEQKVEFVNDFDKRQLLKDLLTSQSMNVTRGKPALTIVFVETKRGVDDLEQWLSRNGFPATAIHGDKVQLERERALKSFKSGATPIIVATDVAARGLDIPSVAHVINFDLPRDIDNYVHRIGRTGRAGKSGLATAFFNDKNLPISKALVELMEDSHQEVPSWLAEYADTPTSFGYGGGSGSHRSQGGKFGGLDYRNFNQASVGHSDYSNTYTDEVPSAEPVVKYAGGVRGAEPFGGATSAAATNSCTAPAYYFTTDYESIVPSGWD